MKCWLSLVSWISITPKPPLSTSQNNAMVWCLTICLMQTLTIGNGADGTLTPVFASFLLGCGEKPFQKNESWPKISPKTCFRWWEIRTTSFLNTNLLAKWRLETSHLKMDVHIENRTSSPSSPKIHAGPGNPQWLIWTVKARIARLRKSHIVCVREPGQDPQNAPGAEVLKKRVHTEKLCLHHLCLRKKTPKVASSLPASQKSFFFQVWGVFMKTILFLNKPFSWPTAVLFVCIASSEQPSQGGALAFHTWTRPTCHFAARHRWCANLAEPIHWERSQQSLEKGLITPFWHSDVFFVFWSYIYIFDIDTILVF